MFYQYRPRLDVNYLHINIRSLMIRLTFPFSPFIILIHLPPIQAVRLSQALFIRAIKSVLDETIKPGRDGKTAYRQQSSFTKALQTWHTLPRHHLLRAKLARNPVWLHNSIDTQTNIPTESKLAQHSFGPISLKAFPYLLPVQGPHRPYYAVIYIF